MLGKKSILIIMALTSVQFVCGMKDIKKASLLKVYKKGGKYFRSNDDNDVHEALKTSKKKSADIASTRQGWKLSERQRLPLEDGKHAIVFFVSPFIEIRSEETDTKIKKDCAKLPYFIIPTPKKGDCLEAEASKVKASKVEASVCVTYLAYSKNQLASGLDDGWIEIWNTKTRKKTHRFEAHTDEVSCLAFLRKNRLASESSNGTKKLWDLAYSKDDKTKKTDET